MAGLKRFVDADLLAKDDHWILNVLDGHIRFIPSSQAEMRVLKSYLRRYARPRQVLRDREPQFHLQRRRRVRLHRVRRRPWSGACRLQPYQSLHYGGGGGLP